MIRLTLGRPPALASKIPYHLAWLEPRPASSWGTVSASHHEPENSSLWLKLTALSFRGSWEEREGFATEDARKYRGRTMFQPSRRKLLQRESHPAGPASSTAVFTGDTDRTGLVTERARALVAYSAAITSAGWDLAVFSPSRPTLLLKGFPIADQISMFALVLRSLPGFWSQSFIHVLSDSRFCRMRRLVCVNTKADACLPTRNMRIAACHLSCNRGTCTGTASGMF